jgi:hypothetical protein
VQGLRDQGFVRRDEHDPFGEKKIPCDVRLKDYTWEFNRWAWWVWWWWWWRWWRP